MTPEREASFPCPQFPSSTLLLPSFGRGHQHLLNAFGSFLPFTLSKIDPRPSQEVVYTRDFITDSNGRH